MLYKFKKDDYNILPLHLPSLVIVVMLLIVSFFSERYFIIVETPNPYVYWPSKILFVIIMYCYVNFLCCFISKLVKKDDFHVKWFRYFLFIFIPYVIMLLTVWPGIIAWDEFGIYEVTAKLGIDDWHSYITNFYYLVHFYLFPSLGTVVFTQILLLSFIASWFITYVNMNYFKASKKIGYILIFLLVITPGIVFSILMTYRSTVLAILELWLVGIILFHRENYKKKRYMLIWLAICTVLLSYWRKEGIYHLVFVPAAMYFTFKEMKIKSLIKFATVCILGFLFLDYCSGFAKNEMVTMKYELTAYINPLSVIIADKHVNLDHIDVLKIDKVIDINKLKEESFHYEIPAFWKGATRDNFDELDFNAFKKEFLKLVSQNLDVFFSARLRTMLGASGMTPIYAHLPADYYYTTQRLTNVEGFRMDTIDRARLTFKNKFNRPINNYIRDKVVRILDWTTATKGLLHNTSIFWNFIFLAIPIAIFIIRVRSFIAPLWWGAVIIFVRIPLLYITEPGSYFMYYFPFYLVGFFIIGLWILEVIEKKNIDQPH